MSFQVETIGDAYMLVSGAPVRIDNHPVEICNMALDMVSEIDVVDSTEICEKLKIRIGKFVFCFFFLCAVSRNDTVIARKPLIRIIS